MPLRFGCDWTGLRPCVAARARIVDAEENRYYLSLEGDLYLYVGSPNRKIASSFAPSSVPRMRPSMYNTAWFSQPQRRRVHLFPTLRLVFPSWPRACHPLPGRRNSVFPGFWFLSSFLRFEWFFGSGCRGVATSCEFAFPRFPRSFGSIMDRNSRAQQQGTLGPLSPTSAVRCFSWPRLGFSLPGDPSQPSVGVWSVFTSFAGEGSE